MEWKYTGDRDSTIINEKNGTCFITFPKLVEAGVVHGFSTRFGGVSKGHLSSMNLSYTRGDDPANVTENFKRIGDAIGFPYEKLVLSTQVHGTKIRAVHKEDCGEGIDRPAMPEIDGLATDEPGIPLYTSYADCVPLLFYDPIHKVIAMAHSGWRGTVAKIGEKMVRFLKDQYGSQASDLICAIGPSICQDCYEVSEEVIDHFRFFLTEEQVETISIDKKNGHYQLDLWKANEIILKEAGILEEHLDVTNLCTCCISGKLFSHRASHGRRGNMGCFMYLKP